MTILSVGLPCEWTDQINSSGVNTVQAAASLGELHDVLEQVEAEAVLVNADQTHLGPKQLLALMAQAPLTTRFIVVASQPPSCKSLTDVGVMFFPPTGDIHELLELLPR